MRMNKGVEMKTKTAILYDTKRIFLYSLAVMLVIMTWSVLFSPAKKAAAAPYDCSSARTFIAPSSGGDTQLYDIIYNSDGTADFDPIGPLHNGAYNALGYNVEDNFIYGIAFAGDTLIQIQHDGTVNELGTPVNLPDAPFYNSGTVDADGNMYISSAEVPGTMYRIDLSSLPYTAVPIPLTGVTQNLGDMVKIEDYLWGFTRSGNAAQRINVNTGVVESFAHTAIPTTNPGSSYGAAWLFGNGNIGVEEYGTGDTYQVKINDPTGVTPTFEQVSHVVAPIAANSDGTSCAPALPADLAITETAPALVELGGTINWTATVRNNGPTNSTGSVVNIPLPVGVTGATTSTPGCSITANVLHCVLGALNSGESAPPISYSATAPNTEQCFDVTATVEGNEEDNNLANNSDTKQTCVVTPAPPVTKDNTKTAEPGTVVTIDVLVNDTPGTAPIDPASFRFIDPATNSEVTALTVAGQGAWTYDASTGMVTFTPESGFKGSPTPVEYVIYDINGLESNRSTITITVAESAPGDSLAATGDNALLLMLIAGGMVITGAAMFLYRSKSAAFLKSI